MRGNALQESFARRAQAGRGGVASQGGQNPLAVMAQNRGQTAPATQGQANALQKAQPDEAMFILKVLAKRLDDLPPHKPKAPQNPPSRPTA